MKVLIAGLFHEASAFVPGITRLKDGSLLRGRELLRVRDDSPLSGVLQVARKRRWSIVPAVDLRFRPGPPVEDRVVEYFWRELRRRLRPDLDGIFLVLHGSMTSESCPDVEGEILERLGRAVPVCGVLDLHATFTLRIARHADALVAYRKNPHTDAKEAARDAALILDRLMQSGERPITVREHSRLVWPPEATATDREPMRSLEAEARRIEARHPEILAVNVIAGFKCAGVRDIGVCFSAVTTGNPEEARLRLRTLTRLARRLRGKARVPTFSIRAAMRRLKRHRNGPVLLVEPSDNIGAGTPGDATPLLKALIDNGVRDSVIAINDPRAVKAISGGARRIRIGRPALALDVELLSRSNGRFLLEDRRSHLASMGGRRIDMGPCAVVRHRGVRILLTSRKTPPFDLGQLRSQGIEPEKCFAIVVKAAAAHRRAYDPIARASYTITDAGANRAPRTS